MTAPDPQKNKTETDESDEWSEAGKKGLLYSTQLSGLNIVPRKVLVDDFCFEGDLGYIFATRGLGKTWLAMHLAKCIALQQNCGPWEINLKGEEVKVLYVDGEMPLFDIKTRDALLGLPNDRLAYLNHEHFFEQTGKIMNLAIPKFQDMIIGLTESEKFRFLFFDNLSTLTPGMDENKGPDWDIIVPFLLRLRRMHVNVAFIHHAGRAAKDMRGHSRREDPSAWILRLDSCEEDDEDGGREGAHFITRFTKWRNAKKRPPDHEWFFRMVNDKLLISVDKASPIDVFRQLILRGCNTNKDLCAAMGLEAYQITRLMQKGEKEGWLKVEGKKFVITEQKQRYYSASI